MKFVASEDIAAPAEAVLAAVTDFDRWEGMIGRRAKDLTRRPPGPVSQGTRWEGRAKLRGKMRDVGMEMARLDVASGGGPSVVCVDGGTDGMQVVVEAAVESLGPDLTRLTVTSELKAKSLGTRILMQSLKLARGQMAKRYRQGVATFAAHVERGTLPG
ncbi:SRPBCC family protein [Jannaschia sp. Os4]|uniref:SRPBCC family protein n=1 Tax=Jannaschia sp. Os4 TaxID=2807617 RepID=UPI001939D122|nr:SRPBCC family protein [Jannaschia sp. Os4]MBM2577366.1 SRPBCC family protein [Jannaschia sp. Os4]